MKKPICLIVVIFLLSLSFTHGIVADESSFENTIYVDDDNTSGLWDGSIEHPYCYIQDGIDTLLMRFLENHPNLFLVIQKLLQRLGQ